MISRVMRAHDRDTANSASGTRDGEEKQCAKAVIIPYLIKSVPSNSRTLRYRIASSSYIHEIERMGLPEGPANAFGRVKAPARLMRSLHATPSGGTSPCSFTGSPATL